MSALEGTSLQRDEIQMLLQGLPPPQHQLVDRNALSPAKELPLALAPPVNPHTFTKAEDTSGQAVVRKKTKSSSHPPAGSGPPSNSTPDLVAAADPTTDPTATIDPPLLTPFLIQPSPLLDHPHLRCPKVKENSGSIRKREDGKQANIRKIYTCTCRVCGQSMTTEGHMQWSSTLWL